jgi:nicotinate-nucleotide adenylyltransferase
MRVGIFGGTFDPVHVGHLIVAEQCREQARLDAVWFVPAAHPPHKLGLPVTPFARRVEMLGLALAGQPAFRIDEIENEESGPSYTYHTLEEMHRRHPGTEFFLILGGDCLPDLAHWREPARVVAQATLLVVPRPGYPVWGADDLRQALDLPEGAGPRLQVIDCPLIHIASRDLRRRAEEGRTLRYLVPRAVECFIEAHHVYPRRSG